jgi:hypothetical protein
MESRRTPPLSPEGAREILKELASPPADTPARKATFARARAMSSLVKRELEQAAKKRH